MTIKEIDTQVGALYREHRESRQEVILYGYALYEHCKKLKEFLEGCMVRCADVPTIEGRQEVNTSTMSDLISSPNYVEMTDDYNSALLRYRDIHRRWEAIK